MKKACNHSGNVHRDTSWHHILQGGGQRLLSAFLRFFSAFLLCGKLEYLTQGRRNARLRLALLHFAVHRADVAVDDADALVGAAGVFLRPLAYLDPLDEQPQ